MWRIYSTSKLDTVSPMSSDYKHENHVSINSSITKHSEKTDNSHLSVNHNG